MKTKGKTKKLSDFQRVVNAVDVFNKARGWNPLSSDTAKSIIIEAAELLEHFQWDDTEKEHKGVVSPKNKVELGEEAADVLWYLITFCKKEGIDLLGALKDKLKKNEEKYSVKHFKGKHNQKYYLSQKKKYRKKEKSRPQVNLKIFTKGDLKGIVAHQKQLDSK